MMEKLSTLFITNCKFIQSFYFIVTVIYQKSTNKLCRNALIRTTILRLAFAISA